MTERVAWVTGASSGVGRAAAARLVRAGMAVALSARRAETLEDVAAKLAEHGVPAVTVPLDVQDAASVRAAHERVVAELGTVTDLVAAAGLNDPQRYWRDQDLGTFDAVVSTNLGGVARVIDAVLPGMHEQRQGTITVVSSYSGWRFSPDAGVAYSASKTALGSLCETLNAQENRHGVRACHLCPGDIDTDFLRLRPNVPDTEARTRMLSADDVARTIEFVHTAPAHICVNELVVSPTGA